MGRQARRSPVLKLSTSAACCNEDVSTSRSTYSALPACRSTAKARRRLDAQPRRAPRLQRDILCGPLPDACPVKAVSGRRRGTHASGCFGAGFGGACGSSTFGGCTHTFLTIANALPATPGVSIHLPRASMPVARRRVRLAQTDALPMGVLIRKS